MTNEQKTEAPERIITDGFGHYDTPEEDCKEHDPASYTRTDLSKAAVGATVRACADTILHDHTKSDDNRLWGDDRPYICEENAYRAILALEPDAQQTLDDALATAKAEGVREGLKRAAKLCYNHFSGEAVAVSIRAELQALLPTDEQNDATTRRT